MNSAEIDEVLELLTMTVEDSRDVEDDLKRDSDLTGDDLIDALEAHRSLVNGCRKLTKILSNLEKAKTSGWTLVELFNDPD